ncbi:MAG: leucyl/phenylalanyl-tRNA--protein transferase [Deltaproteobacteria bacterium]|jgi:leucyl/phenylalanyl-tRNA--protein transferase|nr:leucyl/phenylalanyl-tRNA--protein transferase [Deltaproteobacteria bacterium]
MPVYQLTEDPVFPSPYLASKEGLLAIGGDLSLKRLLLAYSNGIFPWYSEGEPILWWSPDPRLVLYPEELKVSRSLKKVIKRGIFEVTIDSAFEEVITECAQVRLENRQGTWIVEDMVRAYCRLHESGFAHSVEIWQQDTLAGGLYGVSLGKCFFGESMFTRITNASKVALVALVKHLKPFNFAFIDCQIATAHLTRFGAREISRARYLKELAHALKAATLQGKWTFSG